MARKLNVLSPEEAYSSFKERNIVWNYKLVKCLRTKVRLGASGHSLHFLLSVCRRTLLLFVLKAETYYKSVDAFHVISFLLQDFFIFRKK
jgi:hypothetical protein